MVYGAPLVFLYIIDNSPYLFYQFRRFRNFLSGLRGKNVKFMVYLQTSLFFGILLLTMVHFWCMLYITNITSAFYKVLPFGGAHFRFFCGTIVDAKSILYPNFLVSLNLRI